MENHNPERSAAVRMNDPEQQDTKDIKTPSKLYFLEKIGLAMVLVIVTGLLMLPILFTHLPVQLKEESVRKQN